MKRIALITSEEVPLSIDKNTEKYRITHPAGNRAWQIAKVLSSNQNFDVKLFIPDTASNIKDAAKKSKLPFSVGTYNQKAALWNWSAELDRKLKSFDFVIIQTIHGVGFLNCSVLQNSVNVIVDGFSPILTETPGFLLGHSKPYRRIYWERLVYQYFKLLKRANCILYANDRQYYFYEGQLFSHDKLGWNAFQFSPLLKVPYGTSLTPISQKQDIKKFKLVWNGPVYPWHHPENLLESISKMENTTIDFHNILSPYNTHAFKTFFKEFFDRWGGFSNIFIHEVDAKEAIDYGDYSAGVILSRDWVEENYSIRVEALEMLSNGLPVLINHKNSWFGEFGFPKDSIYPIRNSHIEQDLNAYTDKKDSLCVSNSVQNILQESLSWEGSVQPLIDYMEKFS